VIFNDFCQFSAQSQEKSSCRTHTSNLLSTFVFYFDIFRFFFNLYNKMNQTINKYILILSTFSKVYVVSIGDGWLAERMKVIQNHLVFLVLLLSNWNKLNFIFMLKDCW